MLLACGLEMIITLPLVSIVAARGVAILVIITRAGATLQGVSRAFAMRLLARVRLGLSLTAGFVGNVEVENQSRNYYVYSPKKSSMMVTIHLCT